MNLHQKKRNTTIRSTCLIHQSRLPVKKRHTKINRQGLKLGDQKKGSKIDYASTIKDAYSQLNELIGSDGIKNLTNDTQVLMKQQLQLAESMKSMTPLIEGITPLLSQGSRYVRKHRPRNNE